MAFLLGGFFAGTDSPLVGPGDLPTVRVRRLDTGALVVTDADTVEIGDGQFAFNLTTVPTLEYSWRMDGDPTASGQTVGGGRYVFGVASGIVDARIEVDIAALETRLTALRAANLDQITAARLAELDPANLPADVALVLSTGGAGPWTSQPEADRVEVSITIPNAVPAAARIGAQLYRNGVQVTAGIVSATFRLLNLDDTVVTGPTAMVVEAGGEVSLVTAAISLTDATNFIAEVTITDGTGPVVSRVITPTFGT